MTKRWIPKPGEMVTISGSEADSSETWIGEVLSVSKTWDDGEPLRKGTVWINLKGFPTGTLASRESITIHPKFEVWGVWPDGSEERLAGPCDQASAEIKYSQVRSLGAKKNGQLISKLQIRYA